MRVNLGAAVVVVAATVVAVSSLPVDPNRLLIENRLPTEMVVTMMIYSIANERL